MCLVKSQSIAKALPWVYGASGIKQLTELVIHLLPSYELGFVCFCFMVTSAVLREHSFVGFGLRRSYAGPGIKSGSATRKAGALPTVFSLHLELDLLSYLSFCGPYCLTVFIPTREAKMPSKKSRNHSTVWIILSWDMGKAPGTWLRRYSRKVLTLDSEYWEV